MPLDDIEMGRLLQKMDEMVTQLESLNAKMTAWQPIIDEAQKQQIRSRSMNLSITAATWYIRSGGPMPSGVGTVQQTSPKGR